MAKKQHLLAVLAFLMIPAILMMGGALLSAIDPERLAGHTDYARNYRLLELTRRAIWLAMLALSVVAWFMTCLLVLRSRSRTYRWLPLALLGPLGFVVLVTLRDLTPEPSDLYERFSRRLDGFLRLVYEVCAFVLILILAYEMMVAKREVMISYESAMTGVSRSQIIEQQNASSGMWAFSEGNEVMYFFVLLYLLRPIFVNVAGSLLEHRGKGREDHLSSPR